MSGEKDEPICAETIAMAKRITDYVRRYPKAADTCEGIARWWLSPEPWIDLRCVQNALDYLVSIDCLQARRLPSGDLLYSAVADDPTKADA